MKKEDSLYEFYKKNAYHSPYVQMGRNFDKWSKEDKITELRELKKAFERPPFPLSRKKVIDLVQEIFNTMKISEKDIDGNVDEVIYEYKNWENDVYECIKNKSVNYHYSVEKEINGPESLEKMIDFFEKNFREEGKFRRE